jgi:hypothetical protein
MLHDCDHGLIDQRSQRVALAALAYGPHGASQPNPCARGSPQVANCESMHLCLDYALLKLTNARPLKETRSPKPVYFDDVHSCGDFESGLGLQVKQAVYQWHDNVDSDRHKWLPPVQRAVRKAFAVHWVMSNPFDWDNYIGYYFDSPTAKQHSAYFKARAAALYERPPGCAVGAGSSPACCANYATEHQRGVCASYGKRMGDW